MRLTKMGHACVRLEKAGATLVIDPGAFTEPDAVIGAAAILITHEHFDHFDEGRLRQAVAAGPGVEVWTNRDVGERLDGIGVPVHVVGKGDSFNAAGFEVQVHGERHAMIHPDIPVIGNIGFLVDQLVFHPGDAFTVPGTGVRALLLPVHAPWMKMAEAVEYLREVRPARAYALHDGLLNDLGLAGVDRILGGTMLDAGAPFQRLGSGQSVDVT